LGRRFVQNCWSCVDIAYAHLLKIGLDCLVQSHDRSDGGKCQFAQSLARASGTGYTRADDEAHTLIRTALAGSGDIIPDHDTLHIRLDPLPAPRHTAAIDELCHALNDINTVYPSTGLTLRYSIKSHR
jgi:hypothetical protein